LANAVIGPVVSVLLAVSIVLVPFSLVGPLRAWALVVPMIAARCALFFEQLFTAVPGIVAQLVFIPLLLTALHKAGFAD
jgi:competence protein ComEC